MIDLLHYDAESFYLDTGPVSIYYQVEEDGNPSQASTLMVLPEL